MRDIKVWNFQKKITKNPSAAVTPPLCVTCVSLLENYAPEITPVGEYFVLTTVMPQNQGLV